MKYILLFMIAPLFFLGCKNGENVTGEWQAEATIARKPLFIGQVNEAVVGLDFVVPRGEANRKLKDISLAFDPLSPLEKIKGSRIRLMSAVQDGTFRETEHAWDGWVDGRHLRAEVDVRLEPGQYRLAVELEVWDDIGLTTRYVMEDLQLSLEGNAFISTGAGTFTYALRPALVLREAGQDGCHTYRIPGLVTTSEGTLIAIYDNRYNRSKDLQEDIDVGMSRSTDGGQSWESMRVIMDMGEWGGRPRNRNGIGDPCILYNHTTSTLWVAALWMSGSSPDKMIWWDSGTGMEPHETGQFVLVSSADDGRTWSEPVNITSQIKDPEWQLLLPGPGRGLVLDDGTLVFPAQFKKDIGVQAIDGGQFTSHSTIVYSRDGGTSWHIGNGAKPNTTEAQVVELTDGSLMLNMRDDLNRHEKGADNGRAVAVTHDFGETWHMHPSSNNLLTEPNCMASLIAHDVVVDGEPMRLLLFSNPNHHTDRTHMTIKVSTDEGNSWPEDLQVLLNEDIGFGYSCLTMVDNHTVGILYEGISNLFFQKIPLSAFLE